MDFIKYPVNTSKLLRINQNNQYIFDVDPRTTKTQFKHSLETFFNIKIIGMNSHNPPRKKKRMGAIIGYPVRYKRMIITVKAGDSIPVF